MPPKNKNVVRNLQRRRKNKPWALQNPIKRLVKATGIKPTTLRRYVHTDDSDDAVQDVVKAVHKAAVQKTVKKNQKLDDFDKGVVRRTIYDLHKKSQFYKNASVKICVREGGHRSHENDISSEDTKFRQQGRHIVYLDETWLNTNHVVKGDWLDVPSTPMSVFEPHCKGTHRKVPSGKGYVARHNSSCKKKDIIKLFEEAKSHIDAERWAKFETHVEREFEEKLRQLDGIRDEDVNPVVIDMTDDDSQDSQRTIPYMFSEGEEEGNDDENDNDFEDSVSDTINDADEILCNTCGSIEPPKPIQKDKYISWFQCDACDQWVHNRCCTKPALMKNVCRCFSILTTGTSVNH
ncbi:unnamed protein product [Mytilus coruscus]|uniref:Uncharacterized protein n=1 Tax=Mytilus coruscus TaxID=42192 RepID=A0A6J8E9J5_MYTCO|nr:unnamed protein product [Mytilus coruscus]